MISILLTLAAQPDLAAATRYSDASRGLSVIVIQNGKTLIEHHNRGVNPNQPQMLFSGTKTFNGVLALIADHEKSLPLNARVGTYLPGWKDGEKANITIKDLLTLSAGISGGAVRNGGEHWQSQAERALALRPNTRLLYGSAPFSTFGLCLEAATKTSYESYLNEKVAKPLGITIEWRLRTSENQPQNAGGAAMTPRDWATFGEFLLNNGRHKDQQLLPASQLKRITEPGVSPTYGLSVWLAPALANVNVALRGGNPGPLPSWVPTDIYTAAGAGNQRLYVIPSRNMVIVRTGLFGGAAVWNDLDFLKPILAPGLP